MTENFLQAYGLDQIITDQDDPILWITLLKKYWTLPDDPDLPVRGLRFGIGKRLAKGEIDELIDRKKCSILGELGLWHGMEMIRQWCFERIDAAHLRVKQCDVGGLGALHENEPPPDFPIWYLDVTRPSRNENQVTVHTGKIIARRIGGGEAHTWVCQEDGSWVETDEVLSCWAT